MKTEGVSVDTEVLEKLADNAGGDLRAAVNDFQMLIEGRSTFSGDDIGVLSERNQEMELSDSLREMFGASTVKQAQDATMGLDKMPEDLEKWIEESIPREMTHPEDLANAMDALSRADVYLRRTRMLQHYGFWSYARTMMTGGVALARKRGSRPHVSEYRFPSHLIMLSRAKGGRASRESLRQKLSPIFHTSGKSFSESILPMLVLLSKREPGVISGLAIKADLDEADVAYLLGSDPDSSVVNEVMSKVRAARGEDDFKRKSSRKARHKGRSLGDF
jgi:replication factor C large subunit